MKDTIVRAKIFDLSNEKDMKEYLELINRDDINFGRYPAGDILSSSDNWDGSHFYMFIQWIEKKKK